MGEQADKSFVRNFSMIIVALIVFTFIIIFIARSVGFKEAGDLPTRTELTQQRISPVGGVYTDETGVPVIEAPVAAAGPQNAGAFDGSLDGGMIYGNVCAMCHDAGTLNAPKPGSPEMAQRADKGIEALMQTAIAGINAMPARGGRPDLTDEQIKATIEFMTQ